MGKFMCGERIRPRLSTFAEDNVETVAECRGTEAACELAGHRARVDPNAAEIDAEMQLHTGAGCAVERCARLPYGACQPRWTGAAALAAGHRWSNLIAQAGAGRERRGRLTCLMFRGIVPRPDRERG